MKRLVLFLFCLCICGCGSMGSMETDDLDLAKVNEQMDTFIAEGSWQMGILQDNVNNETLWEEYGISDAMVSEFLVRQPLVEATCDEIMIFHVREGQMELVEEQIRQRQNRKLQSLDRLPYQKTMLTQMQIMKKGNYLIAACGTDSTNVIQYISSLR